MTPLWTMDAFVAGTHGRLVGYVPRGTDVSGISIDSRTIQPGEAYFAIKGDVHDGHKFVGAALDAGASVAVVAENKRTELPGDGRYVVVPDVLEALRALGIAARARTRARIIAVTGSVGKTSTKEALRVVLAEQGAVHASVASFNNHWGVPLTLARMPEDSRFGIFEIGMSAAGEITPLTAMVRPHVAIITTVAPVHLEYFNSIGDIARAKAEIFSGLEPGGVAILNGDIPEAGILAAAAMRVSAKIVTFGEASGMTTAASSITVEPSGSTVAASIEGHQLIYRVGAPGKHMAMNSLAVLAAVHHVGADVANAAHALGTLAPPKGRGEQLMLSLPGGSVRLIDESYNANPTSTRAAIELLGKVASGRKIAVLGDMLELGPEGPELHAGLLQPLQEQGVDAVYLAGPLMENLWRVLPGPMRGGYARAASALEPFVVDALRPGDTVMVKGSNGSRMGPLVEALKARRG